MNNQHEIIDFETAVRRLSREKPAHVYFLMGADPLLQQLFVQKLCKVVFVDKQPDKSILLPDEMSGKEIIESLTAMDLFSTEKLFILRNPMAIRGSCRDELFDYIQHPLENHYLVIISDEWGFRSAFSRTLVKYVTPISCSTPFESAMKKWAKQFFREHGIEEVDTRLVDFIIQMAGDSLSHLKNEIDKIGLMVDSRQLTEEDLLNAGNWKRDYRPHEFFAALGEKNRSLSLKLGLRLVSKGSTMLNLLYPLTDFYRELLFLKNRTGTKSWYGGYTALAPKIRKSLPRYARDYKPSEITCALRKLWQLDQQIKRSQINDEAAITDFIFSVLGHG